MDMGDASKSWDFQLPWEAGTHDWDYRVGIMNPSAPVHSINVYVLLQDHAVVWFDDVRVSWLYDDFCTYLPTVLQGIARMHTHIYGYNNNAHKTEGAGRKTATTA